MKKKDKKKLLFLTIFCIIIVLIIQIIDWGKSKAENILEVKVSIIDNKKILDTQLVTLLAKEDAGNGFYVTLPRVLNDKIISKYYIKQKNINNGDLTNPDSYVEKSYGETIYLTADEVNELSLSLEVIYDTKVVNSVELYNKLLEFKIDDSNSIKAEGYMPVNSSLLINKIGSTVTDEIISQYNGNIKWAYDIKIKDGENNYIPSNYGEKIKVTYKRIDNSLSYQLLSLEDSSNMKSKIEDLSSNYSINNNELQFIVNDLTSYILIDKTQIKETALSMMSEGVEALSIDSIVQTGDKWDGSISDSFSFGNGNQNNPYIIANGADLAYLAAQVDAGQMYEGKYFQLANDIDLDSREWAPIGDYTYSFRGIFDGAGHSISNGTITSATAFPTNTMYTYGIFGSVGGGTARSKISNVQFNNVNITLASTGTYSGNNQRGYSMGIVAGTMFKNSTIFNVIVKNSNITASKTIALSNNSARILAGGIVGETLAESTMSTTPSNPGTAAWYSIDNCYSKVNIDLNNISVSSMSYAAQYNVGGIIGRIRNQGVWPTNCLFEGNINAKGFIGPIFATVLTSSSYGTGQYNDMWNGNNFSALTTNSYYTAYKANNTSFTQSVTTGTTGTTTSYRISTSTSNIGYVQGINKGIYVSSVSTRLANFNANSGSTILWKYENNEFSLVPRISATVDETTDFNYKVYISDNYNINNYAYRWYINDSIDSSLTGSTANINASYTVDKNVEVLIYDGTYYAIVKFAIPRLYIQVEFNIDRTNNVVTANLTGTALKYISLSDYTYEWYKEDIVGTSTKIEGANTKTLSGINEEFDYKVIATNNRIPELSAQASFSYVDRTVIYVNYSSGNDSNNGLTTSTAVKTMKKAYEKLDTNGSIYSNVIVVIGDYLNTDYLNATSSNLSTISTYYSKKATVTGIYKSNDYSAGLYLYQGSGATFIFADTRFMYLKFYGATSANSTGAAFMYVQGYNLTIDKGVSMQRYAVSATSYALADGNAPDFHIVGAFLNYNSTSIPSTNNNNTITIMSGTYSRILAGTRNTQTNSTSHNITGSSSNPFNTKIVIDIQESTTSASYANDINLLVGGQTDGNIYSNTELEVKNGKIGRIIGGSIGVDRQISGYPSNSYFGSTKISVSGGNISELYGGSLGRNQSDVYFYGNIEINISGGTINSNVYGAGAGGVAGYDANSTDPYKSYGKNIETKSTINITGGTINGNIYGAGYGYSKYLDSSTIATDGGALYGNSYINISGGSITGNIYGAGRGTSSYSGKTELAKMKGNTYISVTNTPVINGIIYGAGEGIANYAETAKLTGNTNLSLQSNISSSIYGGGNIAGTVGKTNVSVNGGTLLGEIYGGGNLGEVTGESYINLIGGNANYVYGGGKSSGVTKTNISLVGTKVNTIYGGSNTSGNVDNTNLTLTSGTADTVYGGNNLGGKVGVTNLTLNGANITSYLYGGGNRVDSNATNINLESSANTVPSIFGGGNQAGVTTAVINLKGGSANNIFGGSNSLGSVSASVINSTGGSVQNIYGGNNQGGTTSTSNINITGGQITSVFGGGEKASSDNSYIKVGAGKIGNLYGGGNQAGIYSSNIEIAGGEIENVFGGSNTSGNVSKTNIKTVNTLNIPVSSVATQSSTQAGVNITVTSSAINTTWQSTTYPTIATINVTVSNPTSSTISTWSGHIVSSDSAIYANSSSTDVAKNGDVFTFNQVNKWYGANSIASGGSYSFSFDMLTMQPASNYSITYGVGTDPSQGSSNSNVTNSTVNISNKTLSINNIYGGNNQGGIATESKLNIGYGTIQNVYGGGDQATTKTTNVNITSEIKGSVFGGGNQADVVTSNVNITGATVRDNVYGGGNEGTVQGNTNVRIKNSTLNNSVYAGGNGAYATVYGNTNLVMDGTTNNVTNSVFGGGNKAITGDENVKNSVSTVNIVGGRIGKNVYGGANTSIVYGATKTNIGYDAVGDSSLERGNINILGTVFGGGEANESGSEVYDFSYISVTNGTNININANNYSEFYIKGSIFGSGNASSTSGSSFINIKNYGNIDNPQKNVSIQRATGVIMDNSAIALSGAKDRTNEYSNVNFSISRVNSLKLKNNSTLYLSCGVNLLENLYSMIDINGAETLAQVTIDTDTGNTVKNVDNRVYMYEGKVLNIATNEQVTAYGKVYGMTFLGMYTNNTNPSTSTGLYNHVFSNGQEITNMGTFSSNSYVLAEHKSNHNTSSDGFYTNINNDGYIKTKYIDVTPENDLYYIWSVGEQLNVTNFELTLTASKYITLGSYELLLTGFSHPNTKFMLSGFSSGLNEGINLLDKSDIEAIDKTDQVSNTNFGLSMESGKNGWRTNSETNFYTEDGATYSGSNQYITDNSNYTPTLSFYFYHSQNLTLEQNLGNVKIRLQVLTPIDDISYSISYIDININLITALYQDDYYESAIAPGKEFGLFSSTETSITNKSVFSTYYSLFIPDFSSSKYYSDYASDERAVVSRTSDNQKLVYKENTKITMIDLVTNTTYYYVVTKQDETSNKNIYKLSDFKKMGSTNEYYNKTLSNASYYNSSQNVEYESFIFQVDFSESNQSDAIVNASLLMELQNKDGQTLIGVLGIQRDSCKYSIYPDKEALIDVDSNLSSDLIYLGQAFNLDITTNFLQNVMNSKIVYDTKYFDEQMGIKISWFDSNGNQLNSDSLLGIKFTLDGITYYPRVDGTVRINIAERVSNIMSKIKIDTKQNTTLATGKYTIKVESFGSPDGIYYGLKSSDSVTKDVNIINGTYGLKVWFDDNTKIVDKTTGNTLYGNNTLLSHIEYTSSLTNPIITVSLERRDYSNTYSLSYDKVDLKGYVTNELEEFKTGEYVVSKSPQASSTFFLSIRPNMKTGTYRLVYNLYDKNTYIGQVMEYFIIK